MLKNTLFTFAFVLFMLIALAPNAFAQVDALDVTYRDFPANHPGFDEFDQDKGNSGFCAEETYDTGRSTATQEDLICVYNGNYVPCSRGGTKLIYGAENLPNQYDCAGKRGYINGLDPNMAITGNGCWAGGKGQAVAVTRGMVEKNLHYDPNCKQEDIVGEVGEPDYIRKRYCAKPVATQNARCYGRVGGDAVGSWFSDGGSAKTIRDLLVLNRVGTTNVYEINYDYNNVSKDWSEKGWGADRGFFPLDKYSDDLSLTYGRQNMSLWCGANYPDDNCPPKSLTNPAELETYARNKGMLNKLHNYGYTMAGSGEFKYNQDADDVFEFIGDDDMWIFIDGVLFEDSETGAHADLGGVHIAAPAKIDIKRYARQKGWDHGSKHAINFFYIDRQADGSNMKLKMSLSGLAAPRFGAPAIQKAETVKGSDGSDYTLIYVNNKIDLEHIKKFIDSGKYPIIIHKDNSSVILAYKLETISYEGVEGSQHYYRITGQVCTSDGTCGGNLFINSGDWLSFNVLQTQLDEEGWIDDSRFGLPDESWYIRADGNPTNVAKTTVWGRNTTTLPPIIFKPEIPNTDPRKPDFNVDIWFTGDPDGGKNGGGLDGVPGGGILPGLTPGVGGGGDFPSINQIWDPTANGGKGGLVDVVNKDNKTVHGFGVKGTPIPPNRAGELILTAYPRTDQCVDTKEGCIPYAQWDTSSVYQKVFGIPPVASEYGPYGVADPTRPEDHNGGFIFVKNGFPGESSVGGIQTAPTRCIQDGENPPKINCLSFSLRAKQPFQIAVTVYDQLGNFVTQYRESVNEQEFRSVVQAPTYMGYAGGNPPINPSGECKFPRDLAPDQGFGHPEVLTINGYVKVNVNIYPFSVDGRRFGNGVYLLKIDRVDLPYTGCVNFDGIAGIIEEPFVRYHADTKFGWMRVSAKKDESAVAGKKGLFKRR